MDRNDLYFPMLAHKRDTIFDDDKWLFEPKVDGIRCIAYITPTGTTLINRSMKDVTSRFPEIRIRLQGISSAIIDGELCVFEEGLNPVPNFQMMQTRMNRTTNIEEYSKKYPSTFVAFDMLEMNNNQISNLPLYIRKEYLEAFMGIVAYSDCSHYISYPLRGLIGRGQDMLDQLVGWEGVMAKLLRSKYEPGVRSKNWLKIKPRKYLTVQVLGCTGGIGRRANIFGALIIGVDMGNKFYKNLGAVGTGFTDEQAQILYDKVMVRPPTRKYLAPYEFVGHACEPFPIQVSFIERTNDGKLRFPSFEGFVEE